MSDVIGWLESVTKQQSTGEQSHPDDLRAGHVMYYMHASCDVYACHNSLTCACLEWYDVYIYHVCIYMG